MMVEWDFSSSQSSNVSVRFRPYFFPYFILPVALPLRQSVVKTTSFPNQTIYKLALHRHASNDYKHVMKCNVNKSHVNVIILHIYVTQHTSLPCLLNFLRVGFRNMPQQKLNLSITFIFFHFTRFKVMGIYKIYVCYTIYLQQLTLQYDKFIYDQAIY